MTPKFKKTSVRKSENLGEKLSKKRASLGYEIKDVERAIRIRGKHLEYIEAGDWDKLPPDVYVRGFLRSYANFLRLNPDKVIVLYLKEKGLKDNVSKATGPQTEEKTKRPKKPRLIITPRRLTILGALMVGLAIIGYIGWQVSILAAPPKLELAGPQDNLKIADDNIIVEGQTDAGAEVYINNVPIGVSPEGGFKESVSLQEGVNLIKVRAKNRLERETEVQRTIVADLTDIKTKPTTTQSELILVLEVGPESSQVEVLADGKLVTEENAIMLPGSSQTIKAKESIIIRASAGENVSATLNDKNLGQLEKGQTEEEYTLESI